MPPVRGRLGLLHSTSLNFIPFLFLRSNSMSDPIEHEEDMAFDVYVVD
jgi:hypothetical protein